MTQFCVSNLKEKSRWEFRVYAENGIGLSQPAEVQGVRLKMHASEYLDYLMEFC